MKFPIFWILLALVVIFRVIPYMMALHGFLRRKIFLIKCDRLAEIPPLSNLQAAALKELTDLGFKPFTAFNMHEASDTIQGIMLRHESLPTFADMYFRASAAAGYPVVFYSFGEDGPAFVTPNRQPAGLAYSGVRQADAFAENLAAHWQAHEDKVKNAKCVSVDDETAYARIAQFYEDCFPSLVERNALVNSRGNWFLSFGTASKLASKVMACRKRLRKPYRTILTTDKYQSTYYAELYQGVQALKKKSAYRVNIAVISLLLSIVLSSALLSIFWGWQSAVAVIVVLLVHEFGHAVAMYMFGYRDMNMFFVPFVGAFVSGDAKNISVWKQTIILLAGPLPGLIFGLWAISFGHHAYPDSEFLFRLGGVALVINVFNLLPLSFLDGGQLLQIGLFTRWPYAAGCFMLLSAFGMTAFIMATGSYNLMLIALFMALSVKGSWRTARVSRAWKAESTNGGLTRLFEIVRKKCGNLSFYRQYGVVKTVYDPPHVESPRIWETFLIVFLFVSIWTPLGLVFLFMWEKMHPH